MSSTFDLDRYSICPNCNRHRRKEPRPVHGEPCTAKLAGAVVYVAHGYYGCDTGCCGHRLFVEAADGETLYEEFAFSHDEQALLDSAERAAAKLGIRIDRLRCEFRDLLDC